MITLTTFAAGEQDSGLTPHPWVWVQWDLPSYRSMSSQIRRLGILLNYLLRHTFLGRLVAWLPTFDI